MACWGQGSVLEARSRRLADRIHSEAACKFSHALQGQRAQRIEMLLLHEFYRRKFMIPDKLRSKDRERLTKAAARAQQMAEEGYIPEEDDKPGKHVMFSLHYWHFVCMTAPSSLRAPCIAASAALEVVTVSAPQNKTWKRQQK